MKTLSFCLRVWTACLIWCGVVVATKAHDPGLSSVSVQLRSGTIDAMLVLSLKDAEALISGNASRENAPSRLSSVAGEALEVMCDGHRVRAEILGSHFDGASNATVQLRIKAERFSTLTLRSRCLTLLPPGHRQFVVIQDPLGRTLASKLLSVTSDSIAVELKDSDASAAPVAPKNPFVDFLLLGVKHILTGYDHLLFLMSLLVVTSRVLPALKIITAFTVAHSITLALATLDVVRIPASIVEPIIAASIIYVAIENLLRGGMPKGRVLLTFAFGLVHGLGFASVLRETGLASGSGGIVVPLIAFNAGVELGQLLIASAFLPLVARIGRHPYLSVRFAPACSAAVALAGAYWLAQRLSFA